MRRVLGGTIDGSMSDCINIYFLFHWNKPRRGSAEPQLLFRCNLCFSPGGGSWHFLYSLISCVTCRRCRKLFKTISVFHQQCHRPRMWFTFSLSMAFGIVHIHSAQSHNIDFYSAPSACTHSDKHTHTIYTHTHTYNFSPRYAGIQLSAKWIKLPWYCTDACCFVWIFFIGQMSFLH